MRDETIWLTQVKIGELFGVDRSVVTKHLKNIYLEGELIKERTSAKNARVQIEGERQVSRELEFYNLDAILSVGYRVNYNNLPIIFTCSRVKSPFIQSTKWTSTMTTSIEKKLWEAADKLRKNIDAAEYKHVVLGLIFLKYISDAFEELHEKLKAAAHTGADPEDKDEYLSENEFIDSRY